MKNRQTNHWLDVAEYASLAGVGVGSVMSAIAQQFLYTTAPLSVAVLIGISNRRRIQAQQAQSTKHYLNDLSDLGAGITKLTQHLTTLPSPETIATLEQSVQQQQQSLDETVAYINTTYAALGNRLTAFADRDSVHQDIDHLRSAHSSIHTLLANIQANLTEMTTREQIETTDRAVAQLHHKIRHLDHQLTQLAEQTTPTLSDLQQQVETIRHPPPLPPKEPDFDVQRLDEIVNLMADLVPRRDWNRVTAHLQSLQRQYQSQAERDLQLDEKITALQEQISSGGDDPLADLHQRWQSILETVQDKVQALPNSAELEAILQEMLHRRLQAFPEQAQPHQLLVDLPVKAAANKAVVSDAPPSPSQCSEAAPRPATSSRLALESALKQAEEQIILTWPWSASYFLDPNLIQRIETFLTAGKTLNIGWCSHYSLQAFDFLRPIRQTWAIDTEYAPRRAAIQYFLQLKQRYPQQLRFKLLSLGENFVVADEMQAVIGIDHPAVPSADIQPLGLKVRTTSPPVIGSLLERYDRSEQVASPTDSIWRRAMAQYDLGEIASAIARLDHLLLATPDDAVVHNMRGLLHYEQQAHELALNDVTRAIQLAPDDGIPLCNRGILRHKMGDMDGAIADFGHASHLMPDSIIPIFYRGRSWEVLKIYQRALDDYSRVLAAAPDAAVALCRRAMVYRQMQNNSQAQQDLSAAAWAFVRRSNSGAARRALQLLKQWEQSSTTDRSVPPETSDIGDRSGSGLSTTVEHIAS